MKAEIYYLSSTGNSLVLARDGAERLGGRLLPISSFKSLHFITSEASVIGLYFPVYHATFNESGIPYVVRDFIKAFRGLKDKYVFAVCTHNGFPAYTLKNLDNLLKHKGARLSAGMDVKMGVPYGVGEKLEHHFLGSPLSFDDEEERSQREELLQFYREKAARRGFYERIIQSETCRMWYYGPFSSLLLKGFLTIQRKFALNRYRGLSRFGGDDFRELTRFADRSFTVSEDCTGCGICSRICPVGNIEMHEGKPQWLHRCENCSACYQWCPVQAIGGPITEYEKRFHQPAVTLKDILNDDSV